MDPHLAQPMVAQAMVALSEFTLASGATRLVPRSHLTGVDPTAVAQGDEHRMIAPAGSVLICESFCSTQGCPAHRNVRGKTHKLSVEDAHES